MHSLLRQAFDLLEERDVSGTQHVVISNSAREDVAEHMRENGLHPCSILILFDDRTRAATGEILFDALESAGWRLKPHRVAADDERPPACTDQAMDRIFETLKDERFEQVMTVGSGTITDIGKLIAAKRGLPAISFATAASMNGYTSKISAILKDGVKQTVRSVAPVLCLADPAVLADAPERMTGAGAGDAYSRFVASSDWKLSHLLHGTVYDEKLAKLLTNAAKVLRRVPASIGRDRVDALTELAVVLYVTGLAQQAALPDTQASGGEHLVSHYLDMIGGHEDFDHDADLHGRQVAVGTIYASRVYEAVAEIDLKGLAVEELCHQRPTPDALRRQLKEHFRGLSGPVIRRALADYPDMDGYRRRLRRYPGQLDSLRDSIMEPWLDADTITDELKACGAPTTFAAIGVSSQLAIDTVNYCRHVRDRYTILHLAAELGMEPEQTTALATNMA